MLGLLIGFMLGVLIRNSAGAIVAYFVYGFVLAGLTMLLAETQQWFADLQPWVDFNYAQGALFEGGLTGEQWANLGVIRRALAGDPAGHRPDPDPPLRGQVAPRHRNRR